MSNLTRRFLFGFPLLGLLPFVGKAKADQSQSLSKVNDQMQSTLSKVNDQTQSTLSKERNHNSACRDWFLIDDHTGAEIWVKLDSISSISSCSLLAGSHLIRISEESMKALKERLLIPTS
jgi:hypothetical protein